MFFIKIIKMNYFVQFKNIDFILIINVFYSFKYKRIINKILFQII
jgi:hypothetical protein